MKHLKKFETTAEYNAYTADTANLVFPNTSVCLDAPATVHYNQPPDPYGGHEYVEIGGVKWSTMNLGATGITDSGLYFQWADTQGYTSGQCGSGSSKKYFGFTDTKYWTGDTGNGESGYTKYNNTDGKTVLEASDDAAAANWGGNWRMPTYEDFKALRTSVIYIDANGNELGPFENHKITLSGVTGVYFQDSTDPTKRLFFPSAGLCYDGSLKSSGDSSIWTSSIKQFGINMPNAWCRYGEDVYWDVGSPRSRGLNIRPVAD